MSSMLELFRLRRDRWPLGDFPEVIVSYANTCGGLVLIEIETDRSAEFIPAIVNAARKLTPFRRLNFDPPRNG
jgi:hypothetical protein